jgi:hypothetical protein
MTKLAESGGTVPESLKTIERVRRRAGDNRRFFKLRVERTCLLAMALCTS